MATGATASSPATAQQRRPSVQVKQLSKVFRAGRREVEALRGVDLELQHGEFVSVVGPSGCGKTTLLNILAELATPSGGHVTFDLPVSDRPPMSVVFQEQGVFPWLTVLENAAFGLAARGVPKQVRNETARRTLATMGLDRFADAYPRTLSGGMRQRVNVARAFANDPEILLMDEPFASLDEQTKMLMQDDLLRIWEGTRKTVLFITHSIDEAIRLSDRVLVMSARPGRIKADIRVNLERPRDLFELAADHRYLELHSAVWHHLREEVLAARRAEQGAM